MNSIKIFSSTTVFSIDNNLIEQQISIYDFEDHVTLKTGVMMLKYSFDHSIHFTIYSHRKQLFQTVIIFHNIDVFTVFFIK